MEDTRAGGGAIASYQDGHGPNATYDMPFECPMPDDTPMEPQSKENAAISQAIRRVWEMEDAKYSIYGNRSIETWDLYHSTWATADKDAWQSDVRYPLFMMSVERLTSVIMQLLDMTPNWFECESLIPQHQVMINVGARFAKFLLEHDSTNFRSKLAESIRAGLITGQLDMQVLFEKNGIPLYSDPGESISTEDILGSFRVDPNPDSKKPFIPNPDLPRMRLDNMPAREIRHDSTGLGRYDVWQKRVPIGFLFDEALRMGFDQDACARALRKVGKTNMGKGTALEYMEKNLGPSAFPQDKTVLLTFFEGNLPHPNTGEIIFRDKLAIIVEDELAYGPVETPWWDGERAVVHAPFIPVPHSVYGKSPLGENLDAFHTQLNIINLMIDYCSQVVYGMWEMDKDKLEEEQQRFDTKMYPGVVFRTENNVGGTPCIRRIPPPEPQAGFFNFFEIFRQTLDQTTGMSNIGGAPRARGRMTGMEAQSKSAEAGSLFKTIFEEIERTFISKVVRLAYLRGLQFCSDTMWAAWVKVEAQSILPPQKSADPELYNEWKSLLDEMATWDAQTRFKKMGSFFRFKVKIFSTVADRQIEVEKAGFLLQQVGRMPDALKYLRMDVVLRHLVRALGWDPEKVLNLEVLPTPNIGADTDSGGFNEFQQVGGGEDTSIDLTQGVYDLFNTQEGPQPTQAQLNMAPTPNSPRQAVPSQVNLPQQ